jgi:hypothetical protein
MTMHPHDRHTAPVGRGYNNRSWGLGALAALAVLGLIVWAMSGGNWTTANNSRPAATATDTNTGSSPANPARPAQPATPR